jgi:hypothetical protein
MGEQKAFEDKKLEEVNGGHVEMIGDPVTNADGSKTFRFKFDGKGHQGPQRGHGPCHGKKGECKGGPCERGPGDHRPPFADIFDLIRDEDKQDATGEFEITVKGI